MTDLNNDFSKLNLEKDYKKLTLWEKICWVDKKFTCFKYSKIMYEMNRCDEIIKTIEKINKLQNSFDYDLENQIMDEFHKILLTDTKQDIKYELNYEVYVYLDGNIWIENVLSIIYFLGITKKILIKKNILENYVNDYTNYDELNNSIIKSKKKFDEKWGQNYDTEQVSYDGHRMMKKDFNIIKN